MKKTIADYDRSLLSIASSVLKYYDAGTNHKTLPELDNLLSGNYKNVVVMLFDGMGTAILEKNLPPEAFLRKNLKTTISSVFPPTTTAATTSIETGNSPLEHGWLGWSLYFDEIGDNVCVFPNTISGSDNVQAADYHVARRYIPYKDIFEKINAAGKAEAFRVSKFGGIPCETVSDVCETVKKLCDEGGKRYIYSYWQQPDYDMHDFGTTDFRVRDDIAEINSLVEKMCGELSDTLVIVTADHGLIDTEWTFLSECPDVTECLRQAPSIEARALTFFVNPDMKKRFEKAFSEHYGEFYSLMTRDEVFTSGIFGGGEPNPRVYGFVGDYLAVARGNVSIESKTENYNLFNAAHAGMTADELAVPFIAVGRKK